jgi:hypothetical protein
MTAHTHTVTTPGCFRCDMGVDEAVEAGDTYARLRYEFLTALTMDGPTKDRRRKDYNQAIFDFEQGWQVFNGTDLDMVISKFDRAVARLKKK